MTAIARLARINRAREDKAARARLQASRDLTDAETLLVSVRAQRRAAEERRIAAEDTLVTAPADPQALLWRQITSDALTIARDREAETRDQREMAERLLAAARKEHECRIRQCDAIKTRLTHERRMMSNRRDDAAADEFASSRVTAACFREGNSA